ncbi:ATP-binding protein [Dubosiella newyorkensis]|uniref:ATP-binding protein n=1 Tax=Dubosiella newyorkensis TaxID=1862672 RepID=UPI003F661A8F
MMNETTTNSEYQRLVSHLTYLKMDMMIEHLDEVLDQISGQSLSFVEALNKLTQYEIDRKEINMINSMVKVAGFPHRRELKDFDFSFQPSINKEQVMDFSTLRFWKTRGTSCFGNSGVGTHMAVSLGIRSHRQRRGTAPTYQMPRPHPATEEKIPRNEEKSAGNRFEELQPVQAADHRRDRGLCRSQKEDRTVLSVIDKRIRTEKHDTDNQYRFLANGTRYFRTRYGHEILDSDTASMRIRVHYPKVLSVKDLRRSRHKQE